MNSCIYNGIVVHKRFKPVKHSLKYRTFSLLLDLDEIETLAKKISIFSLEKFNIFSFYNKDHGARDGSSLKNWILENIKKFKIDNKITRIKLLCYPRIFGYVFKINNNDNIEQKCKKKFYVSPFMDMETYYNFKLINPKEKLSVFIKQTDKKETILTATQTGDKKEFSFKQLMLNFFKYPLMTIKIMTSIHYEAFLLWKKGAIYKKRNKKILNNLSYEEN